MTVVLPPQQPDCASTPRGNLPVVRGTLLAAVFDPPGANAVPIPPPPPPPEPVVMPACIHQPNPIEAAENLVIFRKYMLIFLPFFHLPATMTSEKLKQTYPFMWFNIMIVTCKHVDRRLAMSEAAKKFLAQKMLVEHEKSLDLLLGLLVFLGW